MDRRLALDPRASAFLRVMLGLSNETGALDPRASAFLRVMLGPPLEHETGYRSAHPQAGETGALFVSDAARARFAALEARWAALEKAGVPTRAEFATLAPTYAEWQKFRGAWLAGNEDVTALVAMESDASRASREVADRGDKDPLFRSPLRGGDLADTNPLFKAAEQADQAAKQAARDLATELAPSTSTKILMGLGLGALLLGGWHLVTARFPPIVIRDPSPRPPPF